MPIYEYVCPGCNLEEEVLVRGSAAGDGRLCATCGRPMERKVSLPGTVIFNGAGYYTTDYKRKEGGGGAPSARPEKSGSSEPAKSEPAKSEPAGKSEAAKSAEAAPAAKKEAAPAPAPAAPATGAKKDA